MNSVRESVRSLLRAVKQWLRQWTKPDNHSLSFNIALDLTRPKSDLVLENALLRQQLIVLKRQSKRPRPTWRDRLLIVLLASKLRTWKEALIVVQPDTVLRWHRELFRRFWKCKSRTQLKQGRPPLADDLVALIRQMVKENLTWGAERIRGELLKLGILVSKSTIQKYKNSVREYLSSKQTWATFLRNHASQIWACDFLQTYDLFFRTVFVFVIIELGSRRVVHFRVTRHPTDQWVAQQLREATPFGEGPRYLIRDNDNKYGDSFEQVAAGIKVLKTPYKAPKANAICERFLGSLRRECLDHILILSERHLHRVVKEYMEYFNYARPHQGIKQHIPCRPERLETAPHKGKLISRPVLNGLHHNYYWQAAGCVGQGRVNLKQPVTETGSKVLKGSFGFPSVNSH
jgi:putative transposase